MNTLKSKTLQMQVISFFFLNYFFQVNAYKSALKISSKDYRAWYGLGQAYELLQMNLYALYYYNKATSLKPYDPRMWIALGSCYESISKYKEAIKCYERARLKDFEGLALHKMAILYQLLNLPERAAGIFFNSHERMLSGND
jgi:anaphase-promoting complex subunit 8